MLTAETDITKRITTTYQWSPTLKQAVQRLRYWHLRLRQARQQPVSESQLNHFLLDGDITQDSINITTEADIKKEHHAAYQNLKVLQSQHVELRERYLEDLAEAIVLHRCPKLADEGMESVKRDRAEKQLKQLISREKMRKMFRKISKVLKKTKGNGLSRVDIPDAAATSDTNGDPNQPKSWKGPWTW